MIAHAAFPKFLLYAPPHSSCSRAECQLCCAAQMVLDEFKGQDAEAMAKAVPAGVTYK